MTRSLSYKSGGVAIAAGGEHSKEGWEIIGYASTFNNVDSGNDRVIPGAFRDSLVARPSVPVLWSHRYEEPPLAKTDVLQETPDGLLFSARVLPTRLGADLARLVAGGVVSGVSIGYNALHAPREQSGVRRLEKVDLFEISLTTFPMNEKALLISSAPARKIIEDALTVARIERLLAGGVSFRHLGRKEQTDYLAAQERQAERALHGKTARAILYDVVFELQELEKLV